jgi:hypothetical protein
MTSSIDRRPGGLVAIAVVAGALVAGVLALLTFGAQATVQPDGLPVAAAAPPPGPPPPPRARPPPRR